MIYWKQIEVDGYKDYAPKIYDYFINVYPKHGSKPDYLKNNTFWNPVTIKDVEKYFPELVKSVAHLGEINEVSIVNIIPITPGQCSSLHTDHTVGLNAGVKARLNIPILNTEYTKTFFYNIPDQYKYFISAGGTHTWPAYLAEVLPSVASVEVSKPTILRISAPHMVKCWSTKTPRITLTISFKDDIVRLLDE